ncbi:MAG: hypothetical protein KKA73_11945 [Chloroflexi bacterium]|nr:hypothetical protein [Chloroflexota bacterium]MBU1748392.1 hypothetical protein [Chloroflexota bacterium]
MSKMRVLILCTGNSARRQMAEAVLRRYASDRFEAYSAGLEPQGIHPYTTRVMQEIGISLAGQYAKPFSQYLGLVHLVPDHGLCRHRGPMPQHGARDSDRQNGRYTNLVLLHGHCHDQSHGKGCQ